jgi:hypothetical protein
MTDPEFENVMEELGDLDSNDQEISNVRNLARELWDVLTLEQKEKFSFEIDPNCPVY